jgi:two-component system, OmpR family, sensor histidine kinase KdpD
LIKPSTFPKPVSYLLTLVITFLAAGVLYYLRQMLHPTAIALLCLTPVCLCATLWGIGPGITSAILSFFSYNYFFIEPYFSLTVRRSEDLIVLAAFLAIAVLLSELVGQAKVGMAAATAREHETHRLYELIATLSRLQDELSVTQTLAQQINEIFQPDRIEVMVEMTNRPPIVTKEGLPASTRPNLIIPLQTSRGLLGEIRLWRTTVLFTESDEKLLNAFATQVVLAVERIRLSETARRARVLEESDQLKTSLLSSVSHELRTPLATIKASVSSLRSGDVDWGSDARLDLLAVIEEETDRLNILVGNILDMSRIESGALNPQKKPNALKEIISRAVGYIHNQAQNHAIEIDVAEDLPLVSVDFVQIEQVFTNLISNSLKYAPVRTVIKIQAEPKDNKVLLVRVANQGPGVPEGQLERIFDKFYRAKNTDQITGAGLGLSICKGIIEAHGGKIWAENLPGGFAFNFTLPLNSAAN